MSTGFKGLYFALTRIHISKTRVNVDRWTTVKKKKRINYNTRRENMRKNINLCQNCCRWWSPNNTRVRDGQRLRATRKLAPTPPEMIDRSRSRISLIELESHFDGRTELVWQIIICQHKSLIVYLWNAHGNCDLDRHNMILTADNDVYARRVAKVIYFVLNSVVKTPMQFKE